MYMKKFALFLIVSLFIFNITFIPFSKVEAQTSSGCLPPLQLKMTSGGPFCQMVYTDVSQLLPGCAPDVPGTTIEQRLAYANDVRSVECQPQSGYSIALIGDYDPVTDTFRCPDPVSGTHVNIGWIKVGVDPVTGEDIFKWNGGCGDFSGTFSGPLPQPNGPTPGQVDADRCASITSLASGATVYTGTTSGGALVGMDVNLNGREACIAYAGMISCSIDTNNPAFDPSFNPNTCCNYGVNPNIGPGEIITGCGGAVGGGGGASTVPCGPGATFNYLTGQACYAGTDVALPGGGISSAGGSGGTITPQSVGVTGSSDTAPSAGSAGATAAFSNVWGEQGYKVYVSTPSSPATPLPGETLLYSFESGDNTYRIYSTSAGAGLVTIPSAGAAGANTVSNLPDPNLIFGPDPIIFSSKFTIGQRVQTTTNINVRGSAFVSGSLLGTQAMGRAGTIISGGTSFDGRYWWNVNYDSGVDGWSAEEYLVASTSVAAAGTNATILNPLPPQSSKFSIGQKVQTIANLNVRSSDSIFGNILGVQATGSKGTIVEGGGLGGNGLYWWHINYDSGADGWSAEDYLISSN